MAMGFESVPLGRVTSLENAIGPDPVLGTGLKVHLRLKAVPYALLTSACTSLHSTPVSDTQQICKMRAEQRLLRTALALTLLLSFRHSSARQLWTSESFPSPVTDPD